MKNGNKEKVSSVDCDVGLGLKMKVHHTTSTTEVPYNNYSCKRANTNTSTMAFHPLYHHSETNNNASLTSFSGDGDGGGGTLFHHVAGGGLGGGMIVCEKGPFSGSQWQEFERQKIIEKYIAASVPVPPQLLLLPPALSTTTTTTSSSSSSLPPTTLSQSNISGLELRFPSSSGSDPEPWRCKRTDGKKWRCSRDVAPDQKYCERHAHKSRSRSRKPVEIPVPISLNKNNYTTTSTYSPLILNPTTPPPLTKQPSSTTQTPNSQLPTMASTTTYDQTRCIEWFMRGGGTFPLSASSNQQQWQQQIQTSSENTNSNKNVSLYHPQQYQDNDKQGNFMTLNPYTPNMLQNHHQPGNGNEVASSLGGVSLNPEKTQKTRHFIDAWGTEGKKDSLTLSMYAGNGIDEENGNGDLGIGMINSGSWMNSCAPGGPLGEALCLGNASTTRGNLNLASPQHHGYNSNSNNTNSSGGSKSSGEDGSHALNFIG